jgi:two-component system LytT family response regulator
MITCIIIDDEKHCRDNLKCLITNFCPELDVIAEACSAQEAEELIFILNPGIIFTDIKMPGTDIFSVLEKIVSNSMYFPGIIFTTGHNEYAVNAFRCAAVGYLMKPIDKKELAETVDRYINLYSNKKWIDENASHLKIINPEKKINKLCLPVKKVLIFTNVSDIIYFQAEGNYTSLFFTNRKTILISKPILTFEKILKDSNFIRVHRTYLVNAEHILTFNTLENYLVLTNNVSIEVSVRKHAYLLKTLSAYFQF